MVCAGLEHVVGEQKSNVFWVGLIWVPLCLKKHNSGSKREAKNEFSTCKNGPEGGI